MSDTLFIQFYSRFNVTRNGVPVIALYNGFSDTYDLCKSEGDFLWIELEKTRRLPITKGKVFISAFFIDHLSISFEWANEYPDIEFVVGGPAVLTDGFKYNKAMPPNIELTKKTVEEYFNKSNYSGKYRLILEDIDENFNETMLLFSYTLAPTCYWGKCKFCNYYFRGGARDIVDFSFLNEIKFEGMKQIRINMPAITPPYIDKFFDAMVYRDDVTYDLLTRCNKPEYEAFKRNIEKYKGTMPHIKIRLGIEFPSDKMLKFFNKGFTMSDIMKMINLLDGVENIQLYATLMTGWPSLTRDDINSLKEYISFAPKMSAISILKTFCFVNTELHEMYKHRDNKLKIQDGMYRGYYLKLTDEEYALNVKAEDLMRTLPADWIYIKESLKGDV